MKYKEDVFMYDRYYEKCNINPYGKSVGDCTIRAISLALDQSWDKTYFDLCLQGYKMGDMPSANNVWGAYLRSKGFKRSAIPDFLPENYSVRDFCAETPKGIFVLACSGHVVAVIDGKYHDTWDSGDKVPIYYWERRK